MVDGHVFLKHDWGWLARRFLGRVHAALDDEADAAAEASSPKAPAVCRFYLGAYPTVEAANNALAAAWAALAEHRAAVAAGAQGVAGQCLVALPSGRTVVLVLPGARVDPVHGDERPVPAGTWATAHRAAAAEPPLPHRAHGKRPRSAGSGPGSRKAGRHGGGGETAPCALAEAASATGGGGVVVAAGGYEASWSAEASARSQRALVAYEAGEKGGGHGFLHTGSWVMAK